MESFNGKLRDELLNREISTTLTEAKVLIANWRKEYNQFRPDSSMRYKPPAPEAKMLNLHKKWIIDGAPSNARNSNCVSGTISGGSNTQMACQHGS